MLLFQWFLVGTLEASQGDANHTRTDETSFGEVQGTMTLLYSGTQSMLWKPATMMGFLPGDTPIRWEPKASQGK